MRIVDLVPFESDLYGDHIVINFEFISNGMIDREWFAVCCMTTLADLGISRIIFAFCATSMPQNAKITRKILILHLFGCARGFRVIWDRVVLLQPLLVAVEAGQSLGPTGERITCLI